MVFSWLIRFVVAMLLVRLVWKFLAGLARGATARPEVPPSRGVQLVRDPVCGTYIDQALALTARREGKVHYFCSADCQKAFREGREASSA